MKTYRIVGGCLPMFASCFASFFFSVFSLSSFVFSRNGPCRALESRVGVTLLLCLVAPCRCRKVRCIVGPSVPNNSGSLGVIRVTAPTGSILNAPHPAPVNVRHVVGQMLPDTVFGCLSQILPDLVPAEGTSSLWNILIDGQAADGERYVVCANPKQELNSKQSKQKHALNQN